MAKPSLPKGCRDFTSTTLAQRNHVIELIKTAFRLFGYLPIETPALETKETLMGKYGEEGDRLIFKVLNSGNFLDKVTLPESNSDEAAKSFVGQIYDKALRYDLTVPFARFVVQHYNELTFPFKRYQIQPVWRADRPQLGRYREFLQCDADVIGSESLLNEVELLKLVGRVFSQLNLSVVIKLNNRKILAGIGETVGLLADQLIDFTVALDKLDKIGLQGVIAEMTAKGISQTSIAKLTPLIEFKGSNELKLHFLKEFLIDSSVGLLGVTELNQILVLTKDLPLELDLTLARGLNYYTGAIIEVKAAEGTFTGSICGGGRYDNLTGIFGLNGLSGVGISFGIDRILDVLTGTGKLDALQTDNGLPLVLIVHFGSDEQTFGLSLLDQLRHENISSELYPDLTKKIGKQLDYANKKGIPFVVVIGSEEMATNCFVLKDMKAGTQMKLPLNELIQVLKTQI